MNGFTVWCGTRVVGEYKTMAEARAAIILFAGAMGDTSKYWISGR